MKKQKKILFLTNIISPYMNDFFNTLVDYSDIDFEVCACSKIEPDREWDISFLKNTKYKYSILKDIFMLKQPFRNRFAYIGGLSLLKKISEFDTIIFKGGTRFVGPLFVIISRLMKKKTVLWEQNSIETTNTTLKKFVKKLYINDSLFDNFIAYGSHVKEFILKLNPNAQNKVKLVFSAINNAKFKNRYLKLKPKRNLIRKKLKIEKNQNGILFVGRFVKEKNISSLIGVAYILKNRYDLNFRCFLVGNGVLKNQLQKQINNLKLNDYINIIPFQQFEKLSMFYIGADLLVIPSTFDPWPIVTMEAMNFGLPIVASNKAGVKDILKDGQNGYIYDITSTNAFAKAILQALKKADDFGKNSEEIIKEVNFDKVCKTIQELVLNPIK
ncbi:MAG: glycosyltransferase family 4 protein [Candidatus Gastranaerophilales bacterium]|nr:glycosyltransferase family 4 protein [Candidatus Gastranaerophilales bacterium]